MGYFRKKPVIIEAKQFTHESKDKVYNWASEKQQNVQSSVDKDNNPILLIPTLEGEMICALGDYLIVEPFPTDWRKLYPCKKYIFERTYEVYNTSKLDTKEKNDKIVKWLEETKDMTVQEQYEREPKFN